MSRIITVIGGISSGKSSFAQNLAYNMGKKRVYIATAQITDEDMKLKIQKHINNRKEDWDTFEQFDNIDNLIDFNCDNYDITMLDCATNMLNNLMYYSNIDFENCENIIFEKFCEDTKKYIYDIINSMKKSKSNFVVVTNEMGLGGIAPYRYTRRFIQLQGEINQIFSNASDEVYFVMSGIANKIK